MMLSDALQSELLHATSMATIANHVNVNPDRYKWPRTRVDIRDVMNGNAYPYSLRV